MATIAIPSLMQKLTDGANQVVVEGKTLREVVNNLEAAHPGFKDRLCDGDRIRPSISVYIDGVMTREGLHQPIGEEANIHFVPAISGGLARYGKEFS